MMPQFMSNIIMEELGLSCTNENSKSMLSYNSKQQPTIIEIKDVTLFLCVHSKIRTTCNIQVSDILVRNYSIILERDWEELTVDTFHYMGHICRFPRMEITSFFFGSDEYCLTYRFFHNHVLIILKKTLMYNQFF